MGLDNLYDMDYVANRYGISRITLQRWVSARKIPFKKIGKNIRFSDRDLAKWEKEKSYVANDSQMSSIVG